MNAIDQHIRHVAEAFAAELSNIRVRGKNIYGVSKFTLEVSVGVNDSCGMSVNFEQGYGNNVKAATYEALLREIYRRAGFDEQEEPEIQQASAALLALPNQVSVQPVADALDDEIPF